MQCSHSSILLPASIFFLHSSLFFEEEKEAEESPPACFASCSLACLAEWLPNDVFAPFFLPQQDGDHSLSSSSELSVAGHANDGYAALRRMNRAGRKQASKRGGKWEKTAMKGMKQRCSGKKFKSYSSSSSSSSSSCGGGGVRRKNPKSVAFSSLVPSILLPSCFFFFIFLRFLVHFFCTF